MTNSNVTAENVLVCDICSAQTGAGSTLGDTLKWSMLFWDGEAKNSPVSTLTLAHKNCEHGDLGHSAELGLFADPSVALWRLAGMVADYEWSAHCLRKLVLVAWAVPLVATPRDVKWAKRIRDGIL